MSENTLNILKLNKKKRDDVFVILSDDEEEERIGQSTNLRKSANEEFASVLQMMMDQVEIR